MTKTQTLLFYKQRWSRLQKVQNKELQTLPMPLKFKQLCFLMDSFGFMPADQKREKETDIIRRRWLVLKKRLGNGL